MVGVAEKAEPKALPLAPKDVVPKADGVEVNAELEGWTGAPKAGVVEPKALAGAAGVGVEEPKADAPPNALVGAALVALGVVPNALVGAAVVAAPVEPNADACPKAEPVPAAG